MRTPSPSIKTVVGAIGGAGLPLALMVFQGGALGFTLLGLAIVGVVLGQRLLPGFWRTFARGALGGLIAGVLVLGPGFRVAMRLVAIQDTLTTPEFSIGGTLFIMVFVGMIMGSLFGVASAMLRRILSAPAVVAVVTALVAGLLLQSPDLRKELSELAAGIWGNLAMFASVTAGYTALALRMARRLVVGGKPAGAELAELAV